MSNTFYVLTEGEYDEYFIVGVFDEEGMKKKRMTYLEKAKKYVSSRIKICNSIIEDKIATYKKIENDIGYEEARAEVVEEINTLKAEREAVAPFGNRREIKRINKKIAELEAQKNNKKYELEQIQNSISSVEKEKHELESMNNEEILNYFFDKNSWINFEPYELNKSFD